MFSWQWECFEGLLNNTSFAVVDAGPLRVPIRSFSVTRNEKLELIMETRADHNATSNATVYPPGTVRIATETVTLSNSMGVEAVVRGVQPHSCMTSFRSDAPLGEMREESSIHSVSGTIGPQRDPKFVIDWLSNVGDVFLWPDMSDDETEVTKTLTLRGGNNGPVLKTAQKSTGGSWNCVKLSVDGCELYLCVAKSETAKRVSKPGFILYTGTPSDEFRDKVRRCLSFSLGGYLVYLGCSYFCNDWSLASFDAVSAYSLGGKAFELPFMPPSPLGTRYEWEIDRNILSRMVNSFYAQYDALDFGRLCWAYWHARCATPHIAAVHFGATVETLQRRYLRANRGALKTKLLEGEEWNRIRASIEGVISGSTVGDDVKTVLKNKLHELNTVPESLKTECLLKLLHLELGEREKKAWTRRNVAAHGNEAEEDVDLIRDIKILELRFHRMLLSITNANDFYYDYFSLGRPIRKLAEPIP